MPQAEGGLRRQPRVGEGPPLSLRDISPRSNAGGEGNRSGAGRGELVSGIRASAEEFEQRHGADDDGGGGADRGDDAEVVFGEGGVDDVA